MFQSRRRTRTNGDPPGLALAHVRRPARCIYNILIISIYADAAIVDVLTRCCSWWAYLFFMMTTIDMILRFYSENFSSQILQNLPEIHQLDFLKQPKAKLKLFIFDSI